MSVDLRGWEIFENTNLPVVGATVTIKVASASQPNAGAAVVSTTTSASGEWSASGLADNWYDVEVTYLGGTKTYKGLSKPSLTMHPGNFGSQSAAFVLAAPPGGAGLPTFQALAAGHIAAALGSWATWAPVITQPGAITHTVIQARQLNRAKVQHVQFYLQITGAGTVANAVGISLPTATANIAAGESLGSGHIYDASVPVYYSGNWVYSGTPSVANFISDAGTTVWGIGPSVALANTDVVTGDLVYETA